MTGDFISGYAEYADVLEAQRILHELVGIQIVATVLNRNGVCIPFGAFTYSLDLWMVLLSGSGAGRSTTVGLATPILIAAGLEDSPGSGAPLSLKRSNRRPLVSSSRWGSGIAAYQHFADCPTGLLVWPEMAEQLKQLSDPKFATVKQWLTDRYDNFRIPPPFRYRVTGKKSDTPTITFKQAPRINILGTSASAWFFLNLSEEDSVGGFLPRWMIVQADNGRRIIPIPRRPDATLVEPLAERLAEIDVLRGEADLSAILPSYDGWYRAAKRRFETQPNQALASAYFNRHRGNVLKLAVVFEASASASVKVSVKAWQRATEFARKIEQCVFTLLPTGMSAIGHDQQRIEERIRKAGLDGLSKNILTRAFQSMDEKKRQGHINTLLTAGRIFLDVKETGGRPLRVYVHEDFHQKETSDES